MTTDLSTVKPADIPRWATNGGTRVAPSSGQMDTGWTNGQRPPFNVMNWLQGVIYDWQQWAEDSIDELDSDKLSRHGLNQVDGDIKPSTDNTRDLGDGTHQWAQIYCDTLLVTGEIDGASAAFIDFSGGDMLVDNLSVLTEVTSNLIPSVAGRDLGSAAKDWDVFARETTFSGNAAATVAKKNIVSAVNPVKAWAHIKITGVHVCTIEDGFNIASVSGADHPTTGFVKITFAQAFADTNYIVVTTHPEHGGAGWGDVWWVPTDPGGGENKTSSVIWLQLKDSAGASKSINALGAAEERIYLIAMGRQ